MALMKKKENISVTGYASPLSRGLADFLERLSLTLGAPGEAARIAGDAARVCAQALAEGDVCANFSLLAAAAGKPAPDVRKLLDASFVASSAGTDKKLPLVYDDEGQIYLYRYFAYERKLADAIIRRLPGSAARTVSAESRQFLEKRFAENARKLSGRPDWQKIAVEMAFTNRLTIISGGPGTGKTTIVTALIAALAINDHPPRIALVAPTGKAAARMEEAMRSQMSTLDAELRKRLPERASTIHMLLGASPAGNTFRFNENNPLPYDLIVVDEASMIDLSLASRLFSALHPHTGIVLLGDKDQLAAVEAGAVFAELAQQTSVPDNMDKLSTGSGTPPLNAQPNEKGPLSSCVVWLKENYRFSAASPIAKVAGLVVNGEGEQLIEWLQNEKGDNIKWEAFDEGLPSRVVGALVKGFEPFVEAVNQGDPEKVLAAYEKFCVLCAIRNGRRGVNGINDVIARQLRLKMSGEGPGEGPWYDGRPIMITENDYGLGVFNGDIGVALKTKDGHRHVWFMAKDGGVRFVPPSSLPAHQTAFAMTVHKAQGSEFENVSLILPEQDTPVLTRELIYTAVTRAKKTLLIYGSADILKMAVGRPTSRRSGLAKKISTPP